MHGRHLFAAAAAGILKGILHNAVALDDRDRLDRDRGIGGKGLLTRTLDELRELLDLGSALIELDAGVEVLGVLAHDDQVDVAEARAVARLRQAGAHAGVQVEVLTQGNIDAAEARADRRGDGALDGNLGLGDRIEDVLGQRRAKLVHDTGTGLLDIPVNLDAGGLDHAAHGLRDLGTDTVTGNQDYIVRHNLLLLVFGVVRFFNASTLLLFGEIQTETFNEHFANLARTGLEIAALAVLGIELKAQRKLLGDLGVDLALAKLVQATEHVAILEVAVVALDGLVQDGPSLARTLDTRGAPHAQQTEGSIAQRGGDLVEQCGLGTLKGIAQLLGAGGGERRQGIEGLPAGLSLGAVERLDQRGHAGHDALRIALGKQVQHAGGKLADAARGAAELLDQTVDGVLVLLCQLKLCQLLVGELVRLCFLP